MEIIEDSKIPKELIDFKILHYKEIFKDKWEKVFNENPSLAEEEKIIILKDLDRIVGGCVIRKGIYSLKFKDFVILPEGRGKGCARILMEELEEMAIKHHKALIETRKKPKDIKMMYLRSLVYLDSNNPEEAKIPALQFANFLRKFDFQPYMPNEHAYPYDTYELSKEEKTAIEIYKEVYPDLANRLKIFKKLVVDEGVELRDEIKDELIKLKEIPDKWKIVIGGLNWKLGHYQKSGEVSYKYNICPICADMRVKDVTSKIKTSKPCQAKDCYIYETCMEPFRETGFFKEDNEISSAYFKAMKGFMLANSPNENCKP